MSIAPKTVLVLYLLSVLCATAFVPVNVAACSGAESHSFMLVTAVRNPLKSVDFPMLVIEILAVTATFWIIYRRAWYMEVGTVAYLVWAFFIAVGFVHYFGF